MHIHLMFLLQLEENIRPIALSGDWLKLVDGWSTESSVIQNATPAVGSSQKRKPGKRGRKPAVFSEANAGDRRNRSADFTWWRGSMVSKLLLQKGSLPRSLLKKAARQGNEITLVLFLQKNRFLLVHFGYCLVHYKWRMRFN